MTLVTETSDVLLSVKPHVADAFYLRLFELAPDARLFFGPDLSAQKLKLTSMLASLIGRLHHPAVFGSILHRTAQDHARLGILPRHYALARIALLAALEASLGPRFTPEVGTAWGELYDTIEREMLAATPWA